MAMHQEVAERIAIGRGQPLAEAEQLLHMAPFGHKESGTRLDHVVEAERQPLVWAVLLKVRRLRVERVEDRQHVSDSGILESAEFGQSADREAARGGGIGHEISLPPALARQVWR